MGAVVGYVGALVGFVGALVGLVGALLGFVRALVGSVGALVGVVGTSGWKDVHGILDDPGMLSVFFSKGNFELGFGGDVYGSHNKTRGN